MLFTKYGIGHVLYTSDRTAILSERQDVGVTSSYLYNVFSEHANVVLALSLVLSTVIRVRPWKTKQRRVKTPLSKSTAWIASVEAVK